MVYNFMRTHRSMGRGITPAMAVGLADGPWTHEDIIDLVDSNRPTTRSLVSEPESKKSIRIYRLYKISYDIS